MHKWRIEYRNEYTPSPLSFWVHKHLDTQMWSDATKFEPPLPKSIPCKGYPSLIINALSTELRFSSIEEAEHFLAVISKKNMLTSLQLSGLRKVSYGPNGHWLSRLPARLKPWSKRQKIIPIIENGIRELVKTSKSTPASSVST